MTHRPLNMEPEQAMELLRRQRRHNVLLTIAGLVGAFAVGSSVLVVAYS